ncbi:MAG: hypothetical protein LBU26_05275 [Synergistaceae bacterium]|jgi:hypothetical protein|nr:hypothetical protein [Synergistaceae bacterium]
MRTDTVVKVEGMKILSEHLGLVDAERFVALMSREPFDYTEWRQNLVETANVRDLSKKAMEYQKTLKQSSTSG